MRELPDNVKELYPFQSHWLDVNGQRMHYLDEGEGRPLVMVHGNPSWSFLFRRLIAEFRHTHRVIAPDHIGCGLSTRPSDAEYSYKLERRIDDLEALLAEVEPDRPITLVLHDWGGMIGMGWAVRHPERVVRFIVLNTAAFLKPAGKTMPYSLRVARRGGPVSAFMVRGLNMFCRGTARLGVVNPLDRDARAGFLAPYGSWGDRIAIHRFVQDIPLRPVDRSYRTALDVDERMKLFAEHPALICWGKQDFVFDDHFLAEWRERWPQAEVHEFDQAGHYCLEDEPEAIAARVREFLAATKDVAGV